MAVVAIRPAFTTRVAVAVGALVSCGRTRARRDPPRLVSRTAHCAAAAAAASHPTASSSPTYPCSLSAASARSGRCFRCAATLMRSTAARCVQTDMSS